MLIFPAIDMLDGCCVRLRQGDYGEKTQYHSSPVEQARIFRDQGAEWIHLVDLNAAKSGVPFHGKEIEQIINLGLNVQVGGGIRSMKVAQQYLDMGATRLVSGTALATDKDFRDQFLALGSAAVAGVDVQGHQVKVAGWTESAGLDVIDFLKEIEAGGAKSVILTDIGRDGMLEGPNLELLRECSSGSNLNFVQSGGITSMNDVQQLLELAPELRVEGMIIGKAIYEGTLDLENVFKVTKTAGMA